MRLIAVVVAAMLFACGGSPPPGKAADVAAPAPPPPPPPAPITTLQADACACKDEACTATLGEQLAAQRRQFDADVATAAACLPGWDDPAEVVLRRVVAFRDEICACGDDACIGGAQEDVIEWMTAHEEEFEDVTPTAEQRALADKLDAETRACKQRIQATPSTGAAAAGMPAPILGPIAQTRAAACACKETTCREKVGRELDAHRDHFDRTAGEVQACLAEARTSVFLAQVIERLAAVQDTICACADTACTSAAEAAFLEWVMSRQVDVTKVKPSPEHRAAADRIEAAIDACKAKLGAAAPTPAKPPTPPTPTPTR
jgi:hypothetical protein